MVDLVDGEREIARPLTARDRPFITVDIYCPARRHLRDVGFLACIEGRKNRLEFPVMNWRDVQIDFDALADREVSRDDPVGDDIAEARHVPVDRIDVVAGLL